MYKWQLHCLQVLDVRVVRSFLKVLLGLLSYARSLMVQVILVDHVNLDGPHSVC